jgi:hypothetical protein
LTFLLARRQIRADLLWDGMDQPSGGQARRLLPPDGRTAIQGS